MTNIRNNSPMMTEQQIRAVTQQLWLMYFNDALFARGMITEDQRNRMRIKIRNRAAIIAG